MPESNLSKRYTHQLLVEGKCHKCKRRLLGFTLFDETGREKAGQVYKINPDDFDYWDERRRRYLVLSSYGSLAIKAQRKWDGIPLEAMGWQRVSL
jgi:hypothetical protein